jgi:hypothetical protein
VEVVAMSPEFELRLTRAKAWLGPLYLLAEPKVRRIDKSDFLLKLEARQATDFAKAIAEPKLCLIAERVQFEHPGGGRTVGFAVLERPNA